MNRTDLRKRLGKFTRTFKNQTPLCCVVINATTLFCARKREREKERDALVSISSPFFLLFLVVKKKTKKTKREIL